MIPPFVDGVQVGGQWWLRWFLACSPPPPHPHKGVDKVSLRSLGFAHNIAYLSSPLYFFARDKHVGVVVAEAVAQLLQKASENHSNPLISNIPNIFKAQYGSGLYLDCFASCSSARTQNHNQASQTQQRMPSLRLH